MANRLSPEKILPEKIFPMFDNYIRLYHIDAYIAIPTFSESITDTQNVNFKSSTPLSRSAPIYSFSDAGPRSIQVQLKLHRDMMTQINTMNSSIPVQMGNDYVDILTKEIQAIALPEYDAASKMVNPPIIAVRFGNDIYIKGVVSGNVSVSYSTPILDNGKYAVVDIGFTVNEIQPITASTVMSVGSYRNFKE